MANFHNGWMFSVEFLREQFLVFYCLSFTLIICQRCAKIYAVFFLYADDAKLYKHVLQDKDHTDLQTAVDSIQEWMKKMAFKIKY